MGEAQDIQVEQAPAVEFDGTEDASGTDAAEVSEETAADVADGE